MTREYHFEEHFWESNQANGYVILMNRMKYAKQTCEKLKVVFESRVILEESYANQILCMTNVLQSCNETGQLGNALNIMDTQWENMANAHLDMATKLKQQIVSPLVELLHKQKQIRKELETNIKRLYNNRQLQSHCVLRALDRYNTECTKANELIQHGSRDEKQLAYKRSKIIIKQCLNAYEDSLADLESVSEQWNEQWRHTCREFELLEVERLEFLKTNLQAFNQLFIDISELTIESYKPINDELELTNVNEDFDFFVKEFGGSSMMPNANDYLKLYMAQDKFKDNNEDEMTSISKKENDGHKSQLMEEQEKLIMEEDEKKENNNGDDDNEEDINNIQDDYDTINDQELINDKVNDYGNQFMVGRLEIYNSDDESSDFDNSEDCYSEDDQYKNEDEDTIDNETSCANVGNKNDLKNHQDIGNKEPFNKDGMNEPENEEEYNSDDYDQTMDNNTTMNNHNHHHHHQKIATCNESNKISFDMMDENHTIPKELLENSTDYQHQYQHSDNDILKDESVDQKIIDNQLPNIINDLKKGLQKKESPLIKRSPRKLPEIKTQGSLKHKLLPSSSRQQQKKEHDYSNDKPLSLSSPPPVPKHQIQSSTGGTVSSSHDTEDDVNENTISPTSSLSNSSVHEEIEVMIRQLEKQNKKPTYYNKVTTSSQAPHSASSNKIRLSGVRQPRQRYSKSHSDKKLLDELSEKNEFEKGFENKSSNSNKSNTIISHQMNTYSDKSTKASTSFNYSLAKNSLSIAKPIDKSNKWTLEEATQAMKQALPSKRHPLPKQPTDVRI
ncbi:unnamed protein product [Cunninghamella blakesleeana]